MSERLPPKTPQELGISDKEWVDLAESLLLSRELVAGLGEGELFFFHKMRVTYLEEYFGIRRPAVDNEPISVQ